jgi:hypothetical protein
VSERRLEEVVKASEGATGGISTEQCVRRQGGGEVPLVLPAQVEGGGQRRADAPAETKELALGVVGIGLRQALLAAKMA